MANRLRDRHRLLLPEERHCYNGLSDTQQQAYLRAFLNGLRNCPETTGADPKAVARAQGWLAGAAVRKRIYLAGVNDGYIGTNETPKLGDADQDAGVREDQPLIQINETLKEIYDYGRCDGSKARAFQVESVADRPDERRSD